MKRPPHLPLASQLRRRRGDAAELHVIAPAAERARQVRRILGESVRRAIRTHGDDLAGFAVVSWDMRGGAATSWLTAHGPVADALMPAFVWDVLSRHVTCDLLDEAETVTGEGA